MISHRGISNKVAKVTKNIPWTFTSKYLVLHERECICVCDEVMSRVLHQNVII